MTKATHKEFIGAFSSIELEPTTTMVESMAAGGQAWAGAGAERSHLDHNLKAEKAKWD